MLFRLQTIHHLSQEKGYHAMTTVTIFIEIFSAKVVEGFVEYVYNNNDHVETNGISNGFSMSSSNMV